MLYTSVCIHVCFEQVAAQTAVDWYNFICDICSQYFIDHPAIIGGPGVEVEIDESKFGRESITEAGRWKVTGCLEELRE